MVHGVSAVIPATLGVLAVGLCVYVWCLDRRGGN